MDRITKIGSYLKPQKPEYPDVPEKEHRVQHILEKYPERIPVYVRLQGDLPPIDKHKYLVPKDLTVGQFIYVCRRRIKLAPEKGLFIFFGDILPSTAAIMQHIYDNHKEDSGLLIATLAAENTFGLKNDI